jgi:hypothetical protein
MREYKINFKNILLKFSLVILIANLFLTLVVKSSNPVVYILVNVLAIGIEFFVFFGFNALIKISIVKESVSFEFLNFFLIKNSQTYSLDDISYTYKNEIGARGISAPELRIYHGAKKIVSLGRGFDGWPEQQIFDIIETLKQINVIDATK